MLTLPYGGSTVQMIALLTLLCQLSFALHHPAPTTRRRQVPFLAKAKEEEQEVVIRPFSILDMLMQRTIQTQRHYYVELRNEPVSDWLSKFAGHSHLDRGSKWHSTMGLRCSMEEYLNSLINTEDTNITVDYGMGIGFTMHPINEKEEQEGTMEKNSQLPKELCSWSASAATRRSNPYLQQESGQLGQGQRSYEETIRPRMIAMQLMILLRTMQSEFQRDLMAIAAQPATKEELGEDQLMEIRADREKRIKDEEEAMLHLMDSNHNGAESRAAHVRANRERSMKSIQGGYEMSMWRSMTGRAGTESTFSDSEDSTPLRRLNFELLERAAMFEAGNSLVRELQRRASSSTVKKEILKLADESAYLVRFLDKWYPILMGEGFSGVEAAIGLSLPLAVQQVPVAGVMFEALTLNPPHTGPLSGMLIDPSALAQDLLLHRRHAAKALAERLGGVDKVLLDIQKAILLKQMKIK